MGKQKYTVGQQRVYWNSFRHCYSIQTYMPSKRWKVTAHADSIIVDYAYTEVSEKTRQRVITESKKYDHAYIYGMVTVAEHDMPLGGYNIYYNPYKVSDFMVDNYHSNARTVVNDYYQPTISLLVNENKRPIMTLTA